jgi:metallo-beta-lactamase family protein
MLRDSAYLQERDIEWINKRRKKKNEEPIEPLYTFEDVESAMQNFIGVQYNRKIQLFPGVNVTFRDAGHILGSASILLEIEEKDGRKIRLGFTGDIGRPDMPVIRTPDKLRDLDAIIMESTYGNRLHPPVEDVEEELAKVEGNVLKKAVK